MEGEILSSRKFRITTFGSQKLSVTENGGVSTSVADPDPVIRKDS